MRRVKLFYYATELAEAASFFNRGVHSFSFLLLCSTNDSACKIDLKQLFKNFTI